MKSKVSSKDKNPALLTDKLIYIIGPRRLQNELMAFFLERETGAKCVEGEDLFHISNINDKDTDQSELILWDCLEKDLESCLPEFKSEGNKMFSRRFLALFNVSPGLGIEKRALRQGVRGFFYEHDPLKLLPKGIRAIFNGELWASREIMMKCVLEDSGKDIVSKKDVTGLTPREIEILTMIAVGAKNEKIADKLCISPHTVKTHIYNIFKKIDVPNRLQAALWAAKHL
ncbi:MAG: response regulator transcription factor [Deltaproteobacteria bacterium]|nr:response regulator transcription factor [Deltaproteobacteria bacterium]MBW2075730.1 response regulator transcription factor [Deltaproteobacteria bacterium]RLB79863.1 MAG: DNA-binding response regulator [Deltaproteobacteria bacterium]